MTKQRVDYSPTRQSATALVDAPPPTAREALLRRLCEAQAAADKAAGPLIEADRQAEAEAEQAKAAYHAAARRRDEAHRRLVAVSSSHGRTVETLQDQACATAPQLVADCRAWLMEQLAEAEAAQHAVKVTEAYDGGIRAKAVATPLYPPARVLARRQAIERAIIEDLTALAYVPDGELPGRIRQLQGSLPTYQ